MEYSKSQIKKLGSNIRKEYIENGYISEESLNILHDYRVSYKDPLAEIFNIITKETRNIHKGSVRTYRIKRIESISSKLIREKNMGLLKMGDIGGCRIIVNDLSQVKKVVNAIKEKFPIEDFRDYISTPRETGYRSYHLMVKPDSEDNFERIIEIQVRTTEQHNWATLVEITDQIFKVKVKEGQRHEQLDRFHYLLSKEIYELSLDEMEEIIKIESELGIYQKIIRVILKNYIKLRSAWLNHIDGNEDKYFILEVDKDFTTTITAYSDFNDAQEIYLQKFKRTKKNVVLTHLDSPSFKKISSAYSNYVLTIHEYEKDIFLLIEEIMKIYAHKRDVQNVIKYRTLAKELYLQTKRHITKSISKIDKSKYQEKKVQEWTDELSKRVKELFPIVERIIRIRVEEKKEPTNLFKTFIKWLNTE